MKNYNISGLVFIFFFAYLDLFTHYVYAKSSHKGIKEFTLNKNIENNNSNSLFAEISWEEIHNPKKQNKIKWYNYEPNPSQIFSDKLSPPNSQNILNSNSLNSLNRSIVFNNEIVGPDISWIIPPGFSWNKKYKFDFNARGHNTKIPAPAKRKFFGWNNGDAVGLISYQFLHNKKTSFGINYGVRSLYKGDGATGGTTNVGEGTSVGFRWDRALSETSGFAIGGEQIIHFDGVTDTGRNFYITTSKGWWNSSDNEESFPLYVATAGLGTGRMAVGTVKGLCSDSFGGSGTETKAKRNLCWSPVFSLASVWNYKLSTYFEYNSRFFLLGNSLAPFENLPIRGNFAVILSDHIDNYKLHSLEEMNWVFNISIGF